MRISVRRFASHGVVFLACALGMGMLAAVPAGATSTGSISGTVSYGGTGVAGVCVSANNGPSYGSVTTGSGGTYTISGLDAGTYSVTVDPTCGQTNSSTYALDYIPTGVTAGTTTTMNVALALGGSISGTVSNGSSGVAGVCLSAINGAAGRTDTSFGSTTTGSGGTYTISGLAAGTYSVEADPTCSGTMSSPYVTQTASSITVTAGATTTTNVTLPLGGSISGTISYEGHGVAGVCLVVFNASDASVGNPETDANGDYTIALPAGTYTMFVDPTCGGGYTLYADQSSGLPIVVDTGSTTTTNVTLALGGSIAGTVSFGGTGVAGVCVSAVNDTIGTGGGIGTAPDGTYTIWGLPASTNSASEYTVTFDPTCSGATTSSYNQQSLTSISVSAGSSTTGVNASLTSNGSATAPGAPTGVTATTPAPTKLPGTIAIGFRLKESAISASERSALLALSKKLTAGETITVTGYAKGDKALAKRRAQEVGAFLSARAKVHFVIKAVTITAVNKVTVTTTRS